MKSIKPDDMSRLPLARSGGRNALGPNAANRGGLRHGRRVGAVRTRSSVDGSRWPVYKVSTRQIEFQTEQDPMASVSDLLRAWGRGDIEARDDLVPLVYRELRRQAAGYLRQERPDHTLQPTALVHEAYLRLAGLDRSAWQNRAQFFGVAA